MKIEMIDQKKKEGTARFIVDKTSPAFVNMLRRIIINDVPTMAIEQVEFRKNDSVLYDEIIAHRLGLMPLKTDLESYKYPEGEKITGNASSELILSLKAKGPCVVYASDLKSKDPKVTPVFPKTPIVNLLKNQSLELEAVAVLGRGNDHAKWSPGSAWYRQFPTFTIDAKKFDAIKDRFPPQAFKGNALDAETIIKNDVIDACDGVDPEVVSIAYDPTKYIFTIESWGQLSPKTIMEQALAIFDQKLDEFMTAMKSTT